MGKAPRPSGTGSETWRHSASLASDAKTSVDPSAVVGGARLCSEIETTTPSEKSMCATWFNPPGKAVNESASTPVRPAGWVTREERPSSDVTIQSCASCRDKPQIAAADSDEVDRLTVEPGTAELQFFDAPPRAGRCRGRWDRPGETYRRQRNDDPDSAHEPDHPSSHVRSMTDEHDADGAPTTPTTRLVRDTRRRPARRAGSAGNPKWR